MTRFKSLWYGIVPALGVVCCSFVAGCGSSGPPKAEVSGTVTIDGEPVEHGTIAFIPAEGTQGPVSGATIQDGAYETPPGGGPVPGMHRVEITARRAAKSVEVPGAAGVTSGPSAASTVQVMEMYIPAKYNTKSELTLDVREGENSKDFDLTSP